MTPGPLEIALITSSAIAIPGIIMVLIAVLTGQFSRDKEVVKYTVFLEEQEEYWEQDERYLRRPTERSAKPPKGGKP
jgi:hypothetical protein